MNRTIVFFAAMLFAVSVFGQEEEETKRPFFFNEFGLSVNRTNVSSPGIENRFGGGAGIYHSFVMGRQFDLVLGIEYNYTSLFTDHIMMGVDYYRDMTFHIHTFSSPLAVRFSIGKNVKYFLDAGIFLGFLFAEEKGETINPHPTPNNPKNYLPESMLEIRGSFGPFFGIGIKIPMKQIEWIVKADYNIYPNKLEGVDGDLHYYRLGLGIRKNASYKKP